MSDIKSDRELLEMAAKAAGYEVARIPDNEDGLLLVGMQDIWAPLTDDGDAFRLAVKLGINIVPNYFAEWHTGTGGTFKAGREFTTESEPTDSCAATRRAVVRAAAEIGRAA